MKPRNAEAARLEADYMARLDAALAGQERGEAAEIAQSIKEHIADAAAEHDTAEVTLVQMASIFEGLGPPESYAAGDERGDPSHADMAVGGQQMPARRFDKRRAAWWSFACLLAYPVLGVGLDMVESGWLHKPDLARVMFVGAALAAVLSVILGRSALHPRLLPGERLTGWLRFLAGAGPVVIGAQFFLVLFLALPWFSLYLFEWHGMGQEGKFFGQPFAGEDYNLPLFGAACVYVVTTLMVAGFVRSRISLLKAVFFPLFEYVKPGQWKWLLIPIAIGLTVAGIKLAQFLRATG